MVSAVGFRGNKWQCIPLVQYLRPWLMIEHTQSVQPHVLLSPHLLFFPATSIHPIVSQHLNLGPTEAKRFEPSKSRLQIPCSLLHASQTY